MTGTLPVIDYVSPRPPPRKLTLEEGDGWVRVIFPVAPKWIYFFSIVMGFAVGLMKLTVGIIFAVLIWRLIYALGPLPPKAVAMERRYEIEIALATGVTALFWWTEAAYHWHMYRRWGRVPRILTIAGGGLTVSRLGWRRMRERKWAAGEITSIKFQKVKGNLNWKRTVADLSFHRKKGRRLRVRLSSADSSFPLHIAERIATKLGFPLNVVK